MSASERDAMLESALYDPVKLYLESLGYAVKGEIGGCDLVATRDDDPSIVIVGELKLRFNLELVLQAVDRAPACDEIWLAACIGERSGRDRDPRFRALCRRLGFGMLGVRAGGEVDVLVSPDAAFPRRDGRRRSRLLDEHRRRRGDPVRGGGSRAPIMTAYRQQALLCASLLATQDARPRDLRSMVPDAAKILTRNVYGWFDRVQRGWYRLNSHGHEALKRWPQAMEQVEAEGSEPFVTKKL